MVTPTRESISTESFATENTPQNMKSIVMRDGSIHLETQPVPEPGPGQVLVKTLACGICGSDLHLTNHSDEVFDLYKKLGMMPADDSVKPEIMLGHEYSAEVVAYGPETKATLPVGSRVTSIPVLMSQQGAAIGVTPEVPGAYSEYFLLDEALMLALPEHLPAQAAAVTEPLAVGLHSVKRSGISADEVALVAGCGPIGLSVIAALRARGVGHIIASDPRASGRARALAMGAHEAVDPTAEDEVAKAASVAGASRLVIFECVGIHQLLNGFIQRAPVNACLVVTGVHTAESKVNFAYGLVKELDIKFSYMCTAEDFAECLQQLASGEINWRVLWTGKVGIDGVSAAFETLTQPNSHVKVLVEPWRTGALEAVE
ncbi:zinc-binding dehydrogenase [Microbulbifer sp. CAU 1566]|uniref:zinc-binding dehydrogenase n=1 Tax=Microbulbifer sp. CAU 1566 TaxID=2933269 RepID=UPI00200329EF|nr:zinc-binding dehydrogenase [Microbulbifer sp. CAU 1566]MCK7597656.1 zinc-binding dehydrogenase [Microbulbifer sp. CAU 1566]